MSYIGKKPSDITRAIATYDTFTGDGSTATFTLTQGAASANDLTVVVNNVDKNQEVDLNLILLQRQQV